MSNDLTLEQAQRLIQVYKSIIRLLETKTSEFSNKIKEFDEILKELEELKKSNSSYIESVTQLYEITNKLITNLDTTNKDLTNNVENLNNVAESYSEKIQNTIENSVKWIDIYPIKSEIKNQLETIKKDIANAMSGEKEELNKLNGEFEDANLSLTSIKDEIKKNIEELDKTREKLNKQVKNINWKLIIGSGLLCSLIGLIGGTLASQYFFYKYENPYFTQKVKNLIKEKNFYKRKVNNLQNALIKLQKENKELKEYEFIKNYNCGTSDDGYLICVPKR